jgi:MATE family multidrug resistance protein
MQNMDRQILKLALPSIVSNITVPLLGLCDVTIMGHVGGAAHIGAIAVGSMIFNVMYWLFGFLRMGTSGMTAQAYGLSTRKKKGGTRSEDTIASSDCSAFLRRGLQVGIGIGLLFVVLQVPLRHLSLWLMQAEGEVRTLAIPYYNICIWGAPAMLGLYALTGWFIGMQNTKIPMAIAIGQNVLNIGASLLFVLVLGMGVEGVALGTVIAQWAGFLVALACSVRVFGFRWRTEGRVSTRRYFVTNSFIFLRTLCLVAVNLYFTSAGAAQGAEILASNTLLMQLFTLFSYVMDGFAYAGEALAGR